METLRLVLLFLHLVGFASLFGGLFVQIKAEPRVVNNAVLHGALTALVTARSSACSRAPTRTGEQRQDRRQAGRRARVTSARRGEPQRRRRSRWPVPRMMLLTLLNVGLAVFWAPSSAVLGTPKSGRPRRCHAVGAGT
jgi:hypothetical protein